MDSILQQITDWLKEMLVSAIMGNLSGMFESVNNQVGEIATSVGMTPANFSPGVFAMVRNISESVIIPIAGLILTFIACYELIQMIIDHNNLANFETWIFFKWVFKTFVAVMLITNTFNITMAVFDVTQHVINASAGIISGNTAIDASALETMEETLMAMDLGPLLGLFLQSFIVQVTMSALAIIIFVIVYGRMIEIYLMVSLAPIPLSTFGNREQSNIGQNYLRSLFAIGFQGFLIMICVGIYAVLIQSIAFSDDIIGSIDRANDVCDTLICTYGDSLDGALIYLENFAPDEARERFEERIRSLFETKWIIELVDMAMLKIREYPDKGALYCEIISKAYLNRFKYRESEMLEVLNMERSTYYDRKKEAILLFGLSLWGTAIPKLKDFLESAREEEALCYCEC